MDLARGQVVAALDAGQVGALYAPADVRGPVPMPGTRVVVASTTGEVRQLLAASDSFLDPILQHRTVGKLRYLDAGGRELLFALNEGGLAPGHGRGRLMIVPVSAGSALGTPVVLGSRAGAREYALGLFGRHAVLVVVADELDGPGGELEVFVFPDEDSGSEAYPVTFPARRLASRPVSVHLGPDTLAIVSAEPAQLDLWAIRSATPAALAGIDVSGCAAPGCRRILLGRGRAAGSALDAAAGRLLVRMEDTDHGFPRLSEQIAYVDLATGAAGRLAVPLAASAMVLDLSSGGLVLAGEVESADSRCGDGAERALGAIDPRSGAVQALSRVRLPCTRVREVAVTPNGRVIFLLHAHAGAPVLPSRLLVARRADETIEHFSLLESQPIGPGALGAGGLAFSRDGSALFVSVPGRDSIAIVQ